MAEPNTLKALLLSDGRPGHYKLAEGILAAVARLRPVETTRLEVRRPRWLPARALSSILNAGTEPARILRLVYRRAPDTLPKVGLIVSAGGDTLAANIAAARILKAPNIFYGSLRRYHPEDFSLIMTSYENQVTTPRHLMTLKPSALDPDKKGFFSKLKMPGLIIGGNAGTVRYTKADWDRLIQFLNETHSKYDMRWLVTNAPRTPAHVSDVLKDIYAQALTPIHLFLDYRRMGPGSLEGFLDMCGPILCTADSSSMLSEVIWARHRVIAVTPRDFTLPPNERAYRSWLEKNGWTSQMPIASLTPEVLQTAFGKLTPLKQNPLDSLAREIETRLPEILSPV